MGFLPRLRLCGLWRRKTKDGKEFLAGPLESASVQIFINDKKETEKHPDFFLYVTQGMRRNIVKKAPKEDKLS